MNTGLYPFWFWNARLDPDEIRWQIHEMAEKGLRGFFIHPRQGLQQPYLSDAFFDCVAVAVDAAREAGLQVHLYDEYPYPSGIAGGEVVMGEPRFHATRLVHRKLTHDGGPLRWELPEGKVLSLEAFPLDGDTPRWDAARDLRSSAGPVLTQASYNETGLTAYNQKRYFESVPRPVLETELEGPHRIYASVQCEVTTHKYWGHFVDVLNPDAIDRFLALTHARYHARFGDQFGDLIHSIFLDETAPGWSARIPGRFSERFGYDVRDRMTALQEPEHPDHIAVAHALFTCTYDMFCDVFESRIASWCTEHGIAYSGEKHALRFDQLRYQDIPGCDPGHTKAGAVMDLYGGDPRRNARATASGAYFYDKPGALCECYHSMGWSATMQDAKVVGEGLLLAGIKYLVPHGFFYSTHGLRKHDAPPTFFFQMPYWRHFKHLTDRLARVSDALDGTWIDARVIVIEPGSGMPSREDHDTYVRLQHLLMDSQIEFLMADIEVLREGALEGGVLKLKDLSVGAIVVPPAPAPRTELDEFLADFERAGGTVARLSRDFAEGALVDALRDACPPSIRFTSPDDSHRRIHVVHRRDPNGASRFFCLNTSRNAVGLTIETDDPVVERALDPDLGAVSRNADTRHRRHVAPFASFLLTTETAPEDDPLPSIEVTVPAACRVDPQTPNLLRLYDWDVALLDEDGAVISSATVPAIPIANQLEKGGHRLAPAFTTSFGRVPETDLPTLKARYSTTFSMAIDTTVELVIEPDSLVGAWTLRVNESTFTADDLRPTETHVRGSVGVDITGAVQQGANTLTIDIDVDRHDGGLVNALYLAGAFGVDLAGPTLTARTEDGAFEGYRANGLPYFAGTLDYHTEITIDALPDSERVRLDFAFPSIFREAAEISLNDGPARSLLWEPRSLVVPVSELRAGSNDLTIRVDTSLIRSFEGTWFDDEAHTHLPVVEGP